MPPPSPASGRALLRFALFLAFTVLAALLVHAGIRLGLRRVETGFFGATNRMLEGRSAASIIVTGSSRALVHYDPRLLASATGLPALNLGRNGSHTGLQLAVLKTHLRYNSAPRLVIHNIDLHSLATPAEIHDPGQYLPYLDEPALYDEIRAIHPSAWAWRHLPLYGHAVADPRMHWIEGVARLAGIERTETLVDGFQPRAWSWTSDFERFARRAAGGYQVARDDRGRDQLTALLQLCREAGLPLILVFSPEHAAVRPLQLNRAAILAEIADLAASSGTPFWDFSESPLCLERSNFYNSQHLNADGADAFTRELARRLVAAGYTAQRPTSPL